MHETGASEEDACEYIQSLIGITWQKMNKDRAVKSPYSETFIEIVMNLARTAQSFYRHGDEFGTPNHETKDRIVSLLIQPFPICM